MSPYPYLRRPPTPTIGRRRFTSVGAPTEGGLRRSSDGGPASELRRRVGLRRSSDGGAASELRRRSAVGADRSSVGASWPRILLKIGPQHRGANSAQLSSRWRALEPPYAPGIYFNPLLTHFNPLSYTFNPLWFTFNQLAIDFNPL